VIRELLPPDAARGGLLEEARSEGCGQIHLDSGVELDRAHAHRLYLNAGMVISAHHFARYAKVPDS
jgi:hypothetical protein